MRATSRNSLDFSESTVLRWMFKAFLVGLFAGAAAAINALAGR